MTVRRATLLSLLALLALAAPAAPAVEPFLPRREVSPRGVHYLVLRPAGEGARFELVRRREGAPPLPSILARPVRVPGEVEPDPSRDPADALIAEGILDRPPMEARVLDGRPAAVLFETWGAMGTGQALLLLGADGKPAWRRALADLVRAEAIPGFPRGPFGIEWCQTWWVDEERGRIVLVAAGDRFGEVDLADGKVHASSAAVLATRFRAGPLPDRLDAWDLAARLLPEGTSAAAKEVAADAKEPIEIRLRAALALKRRGLPSPAADLFRAALPRGTASAARVFALRFLAEVLGAEAIPLLRDAVRGEADDGWRAALASFADLKEAAVPTLIAMLAESDQHLDYRGGAAHALAAIRSPKAVDALWTAAAAIDREKDEFHFVPGAALDALLEIGPPDLRPRLLALLAKGGPHDGRIAAWLAKNPGKDAVPALLDALDRSLPFTWERKQALAALRACTGLDAGDDPKAWRAAVPR